MGRKTGPTDIATFLFPSSWSCRDCIAEYTELSSVSAGVRGSGVL